MSPSPALRTSLIPLLSLLTPFSGWSYSRPLRNQPPDAFDTASNSLATPCFPYALHRISSHVTFNLRKLNRPMASPPTNAAAASAETVLPHEASLLIHLATVSPEAL